MSYRVEVIWASASIALMTRVHESVRGPGLNSEMVLRRTQGVGIISRADREVLV